MSGLDVASGAVGIASLGVQVCQGLLSYYEDWKDYKSDIRNAYDAITHLSRTLGLLEGSLRRKELDKERSEQVKTCLRSCEDSLTELSEKLQELRKHDVPEGLRQKVLSKVQQAKYPFQAKTLAKLRQNSDSVREGLQLAVQALQLESSVNVESSMAQVTVQQQSRLFGEIIGWLAAPDPWSSHASARRQHEPQTGEWLLQCDQYRAWKAGATGLSAPRHMWVHGKPGCGKTVLCSTVVEDIQVHCETRARTGHGAFYFSFSDDRKQAYDDLVRSLVVQLGWKEPGLSILRQAHEKRHRIVPGVDELEKILTSSIDAFDEVFITLDALDECPIKNDVRQNVLDRIQELARLPRLRLFVTSRDEPDIREAMETLGVDEIAVAVHAVDTDIQRYVSSELSRVKRFARLSASSTALIQKTIAEKADGMFRWAYCQLHELKNLPDTRPSYIQRALQNLPTTLDETYRRMLTAVEEPYRSHARTLLYWVAYARRHLTLRELVDTVIIDPINDRVDFDDRGSLEGTLNILSGLVTTIRPSKDDFYYLGYGPKINLRESDSSNKANYDDEEWQMANTRVRLAHFSVKEYLESSRILEGDTGAFHLDLATGHRFIARSCLTYIMHYSKSDEKTSTMQDVDIFPLILYAARSWYRHILMQGSEVVGQEVLLLSSKEIWQDLLSIQNPDSQNEFPFVVAMHSLEYIYIEPSGLYCASLIGLKAVAKLLAEGGADVNAHGGHCGSALQAASLGGHLEIVKLLVEEHGADVNAQGGYDGSALQAALREGHVDIAKLLVERGANVSMQGGYYGNALQVASRKGCVEIVKLLIKDEGVHVNTQGGICGNALQAASLGGHLEIVKLLIEEDGADVNAQGGYYGSALQAASQSGHPEIVKLLVEEHGADVNVQGGFYGSALHASSRRGDMEIINLLLRNGADVNAHRGSRHSALEAASQEGHEEVIRLLVEKGANVKAQGGRLGNALQVASRSGRLEIVKLLVELGADINAQNDYCGSALQAASSGGHLEIVRLLVEHGADVNAQGGYYGNALQAASCAGCLEIVKLLVEHGADVNARGGRENITLRS